MASTMNNLERLIQMATIEQMYNMLQQIKSDNTSNVKECNFSDEKYSSQNNALIGSLLNEMKHLKSETNDHIEMLRRNNSEYRLPGRNYEKFLRLLSKMIISDKIIKNDLYDGGSNWLTKGTKKG